MSAIVWELGEASPGPKGHEPHGGKGHPRELEQSDLWLAQSGFLDGAGARKGRRHAPRGGHQTEPWHSLLPEPGTHEPAFTSNRFASLAEPPGGDRMPGDVVGMGVKNHLLSYSQILLQRVLQQVREVHFVLLSHVVQPLGYG